MSSGQIFDSVRWHHWKLITEARNWIGPLHNFSIRCLSIFRSDSIGWSVGWRVGQMSVGPLPCLRFSTYKPATLVRLFFLLDTGTKLWLDATDRFGSLPRWKVFNDAIGPNRKFVLMTQFKQIYFTFLLGICQHSAPLPTLAAALGPLACQAAVLGPHCVGLT